MMISDFSDLRAIILAYSEVLTYLEPSGRWRELLETAGWYEDSTRLNLTLDDYARIANYLHDYHRRLVNQPRSLT